MNWLLRHVRTLVVVSLLASPLLLPPSAAPAAVCTEGTCDRDDVDSSANVAVWKQLPPSGINAQAHCRIFVADGSVGSGTLIARNNSTGLVLTCAHLFDGSTAEIVVMFPDGGRYGARLIDRDRPNDLAALLVKRPNAEPVSVNDSDPTGVLTACGYGGNGSFRPASGPISGAAQAVGATFPSVTMTGTVRPGDSGGGVLDGSGRLVGVVWGCRDGQTYLTCGQPLRQFLNRVWHGRSIQEPTEQRPGPSSPAFELAAWRQRVDRDLAALQAHKQDQGDFVTAGDLAGYMKRSDLARSIERTIGDLRPGLVGGLSYGKLVAGALGVSGPVALATMVAGGRIGRRTKGRRRDRQSGSPPSTVARRAFPVAVDSPPPPQRTVPETHYVPVEKDDFARAHQWASAQVARKYPGATEVLSTLDSLIRQQLAASAT